MPESYESAVDEADAVISRSPGVVTSITGYNNLGSAQYIMLFDTDGVPAAGANPKRVVKAAATDTFELKLGDRGVKCAYGIVVANSTTGNTFTPGAANCRFYVGWGENW